MQNLFEVNKHKHKLVKIKKCLDSYIYFTSAFIYTKIVNLLVNKKLWPDNTWRLGEFG